MSEERKIYKTRVVVKWDDSEMEFTKEVIAESYPDAVRLAILNASDMGHPIEVYARYVRSLT